MKRPKDRKRHGFPFVTNVGFGLLALTCGLAACDESSAGADSEIEGLLEDIETAPRSWSDEEACEEVFTFDRDIELQDGTVLHVKEAFTARSVLRFPHRGLLMLPGTLVRNDLYAADVEGAEDANALARAAHRAARPG